MKSIFAVTAVLVFSLVAHLSPVRGNSNKGSDGNAPAHRPVLVELFTSEGCSSCPPADALLESLDRNQDDTIVLSEHVDYWNHIGWTDPYSSPKFSERQRAYANRFHLDSVYTPQMVIDGNKEFVGSDKAAAKAAIVEASRREKTPIRIVALPVTHHVRIEIDPVASAIQTRDADVFLAIASNEATSQVLRGENGGRRLHHVAVVRELKQIGSLRPGMPFTKEIEAGETTKGTGPSRLVVFVQERGQGKILGASIIAAL